MLSQISTRVERGGRISTQEAAWLYEHATDEDLSRLATLVRHRFHAPNDATYLIMAIINYTNVCVAKCDYCAFYRLPNQDGTYLLDADQVSERIDQLLAHGGTLVGFNGGFHPKLRVSDYADLFRYIHAPHRVRKSEAELERDAKALAECPPPPRLFAGKIEGGAEGDIPLAPLQ